MNRKKSREIAMELLFGMTLNKNSIEETMEIFIDNYEDNIKEIDLEYIKGILELVNEKLLEIDEKISSVLENWKLERVSKVNLTILRLSVCELLYVEDIPDKVAINEGIELARRYSDQKSISFINGVLDKVFKKYSN